MRRICRRISPGKSCETPYIYIYIYIYAAHMAAHIQKTTLRHAILSGWRRKNVENPFCHKQKSTV